MEVQINDQSAHFEKSPKRSSFAKLMNNPTKSEDVIRGIVSPKQDRNEFALTELNLCAIYS